MRTPGPEVKEALMSHYYANGARRLRNRNTVDTGSTQPEQSRAG